jgi:hypothetical protein
LKAQSNQLFCRSAIVKKPAQSKCHRIDLLNCFNRNGTNRPQLEATYSPAPNGNVQAVAKVLGLRLELMEENV